jgi:hypothetical protein
MFTRFFIRRLYEYKLHEDSPFDEHMWKRAPSSIRSRRWPLRQKQVRRTRIDMKTNQYSPFCVRKILSSFSQRNQPTRPISKEPNDTDFWNSWQPLLSEKQTNKSNKQKHHNCCRHTERQTYSLFFWETYNYIPFLRETYKHSPFYEKQTNTTKKPTNSAHLLW